MFIARQAIFDRSLKAFGYELLFRQSDQSTAYTDTAPEISTATVLGGLFELGLDKIVGKEKAFVNFDYNFLMSDSIELVDPETLVIEILEDTKVDDRLIERIKELKKRGYTIALDDFVESLSDYPIVPFADLIKYDIIQTPLETIKDQVERALGQKKILLAEKIETEKEFLLAKEMGFHLFQGFFFNKPKIVGGLKSRKTPKAVYQRIINELNQEEPSYTKLAEIIEMDVNLAYRFMKVLSRKDSSDSKVTIQRSIARMGLKELERWVNVLMLQELSDKKPLELMRLSLVRFKFGEKIAIHSRFARRKDEISLMCLFSVLDAMLDQTMEESLEGVSVSDDVKEALINRDGPLKPIYEIINCYEECRWEELKKVAASIGAEQEEIFHWYLDAIAWANDIMRLM